MRLVTDFSLLMKAIDRMGAAECELDFSVARDGFDLALDSELERGKEISLDDLDVAAGVLSLHGRQVLLYIPDQGGNIQAVLENPKKGRKFHIADCSTLENMKALCVDCHRKEPFHQRMFVRHQDMILINKLRREQKKIGQISWEKTFQLADPAVHGLLHILKNKHEKIPEIGYELINEKHEVELELELAWPKKNKGTCLTRKGADIGIRLGWDILTLGEIMNQYR